MLIPLPVNFVPCNWFYWKLQRQLTTYYQFQSFRCKKKHFKSTLFLCKLSPLLSIFSFCFRLKMESFILLKKKKKKWMMMKCMKARLVFPPFGLLLFRLPFFPSFLIICRTKVEIISSWLGLQRNSEKEIIYQWNTPRCCTTIDSLVNQYSSAAAFWICGNIIENSKLTLKTMYFYKPRQYFPF